MSLSFLDLRQMDSEMETAGIAGGGGSQEQKPLQQACVSKEQDGLLPSSTLPCMATWAEQAPSRCLPLPLSDSEGSAFLSETSFQRGVKVFHPLMVLNLGHTASK